MSKGNSPEFSQTPFSPKSLINHTLIPSTNQKPFLTSHVMPIELYIIMFNIHHHYLINFDHNRTKAYKDFGVNNIPLTLLGPSRGGVI